MIEGPDEVCERLSEGGWEGVHPGGEQGVPAQHVGLHVDHATPRHLQTIEMVTETLTESLKYEQMWYVYTIETNVVRLL